MEASSHTAPPNAPLMSMTGYGIKQTSSDLGVFRCEIRSVNNRYLEVQVRGPREFLFLEHTVSSFIKQKIERGKVDVFFDAKLQKSVGGIEELEKIIRGSDLERYLDLYSELEKKVRHRGLVVRSLDLQRLLGDVGFGRGSGLGDSAGSDGNGDRAPIEKAVLEVVEGALEGLLNARKNEGESLRRALFEPLEIIDHEVQSLATAYESIRQDLKEQHRKRLVAAVEAVELLGDPAQKRSREERILLELALLQDKQDIAEELTRLKVHLRHMDEIVSRQSPDPRFSAQTSQGSSDTPQGGTRGSEIPHHGKSKGHGKKLDFLCQEMFREINTMSNKLLQLTVLEKTVQMKQQVERIRQQIQNIE